MKTKLIRIKETILRSICRLFQVYKYYLIVFFIVFLIFFITGIMTCAKYSSDISCGNLINKYMYSFLTRELSYISFFLVSTIFFVLASLIFLLLTNNLFFKILDILILILMSYIWGFDICVIILTLGLAGVFFGAIVLGGFGLIIF